jgi:hypothetical protein
MTKYEEDGETWMETILSQKKKEYRKTKTLFKCSKAKLCLQFEPPRNTFKFQKHYMCVLHVKNKGRQR